MCGTPLRIARETGEKGETLGIRVASRACRARRARRAFERLVDFFSILLESEKGRTQRGRGMIQERKPAVVLIAEDDHEMRSLLCDELYDLGVSIREASDGDEALRSVLDARPSLILTDLRMPAGGLDYIARLRTFAPGVPMVLITSFGNPQTKAEALAIGVEAYFDKPVRLSELKGAVRRLLGPALDGKID